MRNLLWVMFAAVVMGLAINSLSSAQGLQSSPYAAPSLLRRDALGPAPSNSSNRPYAHSPFLTKPEGLLSGTSSKRDVPNLQAGYIYYSGKKQRVGYFTLDYILPIRLGENSIVFGAAHSELQASSTTATSKADDQAYLSAGGGYRTILRKTTLLGFHAFYDTARFADRWVTSGGAGVEMALLMPGHDAVDMNSNWYGDLSEGDLVNQFRDGPANFDFQIGYSHQLFDRGPDLRLFGTAYNFDDGSGVYGWQAGAELKSPDGVVSVKCETAYDPVNDAYQSVSAFVNIGFQLENLFKGKNPFVMPEPIFSSPRNVTRLTEKVKRNWRHTTHGVVGLTDIDNGRVVQVVNNLDTKQTVFVKFLKNNAKPCQQWGANGQYTPADFPGWTASQTDCNLLSADLDPKQSLPLPFSKPANGDTTFTVTMATTTGCKLTQAEITVHNFFGNEWHDGYDISLVNGFNYKVKINAPYTDVRDPYTPGNPFRCLSTIQATSQLGNSNNPGVFGLGNDQCCASCQPPADCCAEWGDKIAAEAHPTYNNAPANCPVADPYAPCANANPKPVHGGAQRCDARPRCQMDGWHSQATGKVFTVTFDKPD